MSSPASAAGADTWACILELCITGEDTAPQMIVLLRVSAACRAAREALGLVQSLMLSRAGDFHAQVLARFATVRRVSVRCFQRACSLEEAVAANPGTEAHSTRAGLLQYVGTEPAPGEENAWDDGGGDAAGPIQIADEAMARRLPFALCALVHSRKRYIHLKIDRCSESRPMRLRGG